MRTVAVEVEGVEDEPAEKSAEHDEALRCLNGGNEITACTAGVFQLAPRVNLRTNKVNRGPHYNADATMTVLQACKEQLLHLNLFRKAL